MELDIAECCVIDGDAEFPYNYEFKVTDGLSNFIAPYCYPCPYEFSSSYSRLLGSEPGQCTGSFVYLLVLGLVTFLFYAFVAVKRARVSLTNVAFAMALLAMFLSLAQIVGGALGLSGNWCVGTGPIVAYRQLRGIGFAFFFLILVLQSFWYNSMLVKQLKDVGNVFGAALRIPLVIVSIAVVFLVAILEPNASAFFPAAFGATTAGPFMARVISWFVYLIAGSFLATLLAVNTFRVTKSLSSGDDAGWRAAALSRLSNTSFVVLFFFSCFLIVAFLAAALPAMQPISRFEVTSEAIVLQVVLFHLLPHAVIIAVLSPFILPSSRAKGGSATSSTSDSLADSLLDDSSDSDSSSSSSSSSSSDSSSSSVELSEI
mmetsp:Transcript_4663/g.15105  ORF Transcript_4663/g.15105 Transcript_4663/m.15105 type:complete len:374 (-) Transcript_4663:31-1152(-)